MTKDELFSYFVRELRDALSNLAAEPTKQKLYLQQIGLWPMLDELANDFEDFYVPLKEDLQLSAEHREALAQVDQKLEQMSGQENARLWAGEEDALLLDNWSDVRRLAAHALHLLDSVSLGQQ